MLTKKYPSSSDSVFCSADVEEHAGSVPGHPAGLLGEGVFLQRGHAGVLLRPGPRDVPAHSELLPHREAALPAARVHPGLRRGAGLLRHRARDHRRLLHGGRRGLVFICVGRGPVVPRGVLFVPFSVHRQSRGQSSDVWCCLGLSGLDAIP